MIVYLRTEFDDSSCRRFRDIIGGPQKKIKWVTWTWLCPFYGWFVHHMLDISIAYPYAKFDHSSFSRSKDVVSSHQNLNGSRDLTTPLSKMFCHPWLGLANINLPTKFEVSNSAFETKGLRKILRVSWTAKKTNKWVLDKAGVKKELLDTVKTKKWRDGHTMRKQGRCLGKR